ncbi:hypothetical protein B0H34DRAFT_678696 [Crassisporium funariophilum]|nr:hypothetical protein B0H34DRAFT_678696 [Crassisporium funariophilum]
MLKHSNLIFGLLGNTFTLQCMRFKGDADNVELIQEDVELDLDIKQEHNFCKKNNSPVYPGQEKDLPEGGGKGDDFHAQMKKGNALLPSWINAQSPFMAEFQQEQRIDNFTFDETRTQDDDELGYSSELGKMQFGKEETMQEMCRIIRDLEWHNPESDLLPDDANLAPEPPESDIPESQQFPQGCRSKCC